MNYCAPPGSKPRAQEFRAKYADTRIKWHVKAQGTKSPCDGDWAYWTERLGRDPSKPNRVIALLKNQLGRCLRCGLRFMSEDHLENHHRNGNHNDNVLANLALLRGHKIPWWDCHDEVHRTKACPECSCRVLVILCP